MSNDSITVDGEHFVVDQILDHVSGQSRPIVAVITLMVRVLEGLQAQDQAANEFLAQHRKSQSAVATGRTPRYVDQWDFRGTRAVAEVYPTHK